LTGINLIIKNISLELMIKIEYIIVRITNNNIFIQKMENKDIVLNILQHLKIKDIGTCSAINKLIQEICDMQYKRLLISDCGSFFWDIYISFKQSCVKCYHLDLLWKFCNIGNSLINFFLLTEINLSSRRIGELPATIGKLVNLQILILYDNQIKVLPATIEQLVNLQELWLDNNQIKELPVTIGKLVNLRILSLCYNQISELSATFGQLVNLKQLCLNNN